MAAPDRRADPADLGRRRSPVPAGARLGVSGAHSGIESRDRARMRSHAPRGEAVRVRQPARTLHQESLGAFSSEVGTGSREENATTKEGRVMKFFNFHLMPYRHVDLDAIERNGSAWVT